MRLWLILLVGLLCFAMTSCPVPEDDYEDTQTAIDDEGKRQPEFTEEEVATTDGEEAVVCEACGQDPCVCEDAVMEGEEDAGEEGAVCEHCGMDPCECEGHEHGDDAGEEMEDADADDEEEAAVCPDCGKDPCECE